MATLVQPIPPPHLPSDFEEVIILESDTICESLKKYLKFMVMFWQFTKWMHKAADDSELSASFKAMICNAFAECDDSSPLDNPITE